MVQSGVMGIAAASKTARRSGPRWTRYTSVAGLILAGGLALRLVLGFVVYRGEGFPGDLMSFQSWAQTAAAKGPSSFYRAARSANYPPGYIWMLWLLGGLSRPVAALTGASRDGTLLALLKLPAILADMAIAWILLRAGRRWFGGNAGLWAAALYLFVPVTWLDSAIWGQVDAVSALVMLAAIVALVDGRSERALILCAGAILIKPQALVCLVIVVPVLIRRHLIRPRSGPEIAGRRGLAALAAGREWARLAIAAGAAGIVALVVMLPFDLQVFAGGRWRDVPVADKFAGLVGLIRSVSGQYPVLTANAYNVWALIGQDPLARTIGTGRQSWIDDSVQVLGIQASTIGTAALAAASLLAIVGLLRRDDRTTILLGFVVVAFAFYAAPTRVHERYLFPVFAVGALLAASGLRRLAYAAVATINAVNLWAVLASPIGFSFGGRGTGGPTAGGITGTPGAGGGPPTGAGTPPPRGGFPPGGGGFGSSGARNARLAGSSATRDHLTVLLVSCAQTAALFILVALFAMMTLRSRPALQTSPSTSGAGNHGDVDSTEDFDIIVPGG